MFQDKSAHNHGKDTQWKIKNKKNEIKGPNGLKKVLSRHFELREISEEHTTRQKDQIR
jgi:hypothetical protein